MSQLVRNARRQRKCKICHGRGVVLTERGAHDLPITNAIPDTIVPEVIPCFCTQEKLIKGVLTLELPSRGINRPNRKLFNVVAERDWKLSEKKDNIPE